MTERARGRSAWSELGLRPGAGADEVQAAWRRLAARHHPDAGGDPVVFRTITAARDQLLGSADREPAPELHRAGPLHRALRPLRRRIDRRRRPRVV